MGFQAATAEISAKGEKPELARPVVKQLFSDTEAIGLNRRYQLAKNCTVIHVG